jgi:hypothetical protein
VELPEIDEPYAKPIVSRNMAAIQSPPISHSEIESHATLNPCSKHLIQAIIFCTSVIVLTKWGTGLSEWREVIASENGPVERMSAAVWFMGFTWCLAAAYGQRAKAVEWLSVAMFLLLFGLRELDAHIWSTGWNLDKLANYWNPQYPLSERISVLAFIVLPCLAVGGLLCLRLLQSIGPAWRSGELWLSHLAVAGPLLGVCLSLDKVGSYALPFLGISDVGQVFVMVIEEFLEFILAVFTMTVLWPYLQEALNCHE